MFIRTMNRKQSGFALIAILSISLVMMVLSTALLVKATTMRRDGNSQRGSVETFYAADAAINTLLGQLNQLQLGTNPITFSQLSANLQAITSSKLSQVTVTTDAASGRLVAGSSYTTSGNVATNATPQDLGLGTGFLIYSLIENDASGTPLTSCSQFSSSCSIPANVGSIAVEAIGFKGRGAASAVSATIVPGAAGGPQNWFLKNKYAVFSENDVTMGNGDTYSGMPFKYNGTIVYIRAICQLGTTITPRTSACNPDETPVTSVTPSVTSALKSQGYTPDSDGMTPEQIATYNYNYLPQGNQGNVANNSSSGGAIVINSTGVINGSATNYGCSGSGCINGNGTITGDATTYGCDPATTSNCISATVKGLKLGTTATQKLTLPAPPPRSCYHGDINNPGQWHPNFEQGHSGQLLERKRPADHQTRFGQYEWQRYVDPLFGQVRAHPEPQHRWQPGLRYFSECG